MMHVSLSSGHALNNISPHVNVYTTKAYPISNLVYIFYLLQCCYDTTDTTCDEN